MLKTKCDLLAENTVSVKKGFSWWERSIVQVIAATVYTNEGRRVDAQRMKECRKVLRNNHGIFSDFRKCLELMIVAKLAIADNPEAYLCEVQDIYAIVRNGKFFGSEHMVMAAMNIVDSGYKDANEIAAKTVAIFAQMKKRHRFLTDNTDIPFAALLALTDKNIDQIIDEIDWLYDILKGQFRFYYNNVHSLSQILAISSGSVEIKCNNTIEFYDALQANGIKYGKGIELPALGALVNLNMPAMAIATEIKDASNYLEGKKGFGNFTMGKHLRNIFATILTASIYACNDAAIGTSIISRAIAIIVAQQVAMMTACSVMMATSNSNRCF